MMGDRHSPVPVCVCVLGGIRLLKGTDVFISTWIMHRSPELWDEPDEFEPDRWLKTQHNDRAKVHTHTGTRTCGPRHVCVSPS